MEEGSICSKLNLLPHFASFQSFRPLFGELSKAMFVGVLARYQFGVAGHWFAFILLSKVGISEIEGGMGFERESGFGEFGV